MAGFLRIDDIDFIADIDAIGNGLFMVVFANDVLFEEAVGAVVRCGSQADEVSIEIFKNLTPNVVNRAVAFVDDDEVKELRWNPVVITDRHWLFKLNPLRRIDLLGGFIQILALQNRIHSLDGADTDLTVLCNVGRLEALDVV